MRSRLEERSLIKAANCFFEAEMFSVLKHHRKMRNTRETRRRACEVLLWWFRVLWEVAPVSGWTGVYDWVGHFHVMKLLAICGKEKQLLGGFYLRTAQTAHVKQPGVSAKQP